MASRRASSFCTRARGVLVPVVVEGEDQGARKAGSEAGSLLLTDVLLPMVVEGEDQGARKAGKGDAILLLTEGGETGEEGRRKADEVEAAAATSTRMRGRDMLEESLSVWLSVLCVGWTWSAN